MLGPVDKHRAHGPLQVADQVLNRRVICIAANAHNVILKSRSGDVDKGFRREIHLAVGLLGGRHADQIPLACIDVVQVQQVLHVRAQVAKRRATVKC